ncbi:hypothetical protein FQA47_011462 [Oryzias melastigma]|uniref:Uncharacterized protein n=1 Tax=Oryzias melastigma TaxID=30732 RepID=A0A834FH46_ORYME|nr:hypothetical protein FQA47_011462 [Oryzias melastigma]
MGTCMPAPEHSCAELCGNSVTQLFSRLLASHFPHPPGLLGDFKKEKSEEGDRIPLPELATWTYGHDHEPGLRFTALCPFPAGGDTFSLQQKHWWQLLSNIKGSFSPEDGKAGCQREEPLYRSLLFIKAADTLQALCFSSERQIPPFAAFELHRNWSESLTNYVANKAAQPGQPVAVGDLQISDVAVMPLMKLTQHSLPPHKTPKGLWLCMERHKHPSTPISTKFKPNELPSRGEGEGRRSQRSLSVDDLPSATGS